MLDFCGGTALYPCFSIVVGVDIFSLSLRAVVVYGFNVLLMELNSNLPSGLVLRFRA